MLGKLSKWGIKNQHLTVELLESDEKLSRFCAIIDKIRQ